MRITRHQLFRLIREELITEAVKTEAPEEYHVDNINADGIDEDEDTAPIDEAGESGIEYQGSPGTGEKASPPYMRKEHVHITKRQLRRIIREVLGAPSLNQWADENNLEVDIDPFTGEEVVLIDDDFAARQGLPDGVDWGVERARDDSGWIVTTGGMEPEFEEFAAGDLSDLDDIGIQRRGY